VQAAWEQLCSDEKRREYESSNIAALHSTHVNHAENVPLSEMQKRVASEEELAPADEEGEAHEEGGRVGVAQSGAADGDGVRAASGADAAVLYLYRRACRCGDSYDISSEELRQGFNTVQCGGCSLYITVVT